MLNEIKQELKGVENFSIESIGDIAYVMENKKKMKQLHAILLITGLPINIIQWTSIILWIFTGIWWLFALWVLIAISYAIWVTKFYFKRVAYICPQCHEVFKPKLKEAIFARHTPTLRKLTCTCCGYKGFCVETYGEEKKRMDKFMEEAIVLCGSLLQLSAWSLSVRSYTSCLARRIDMDVLTI